MAYKAECPKCGKDSLFVTSGVFMTLGMPLGSDGFSFTDAQQVSTDEEKVECHSCGATFDLSELITEDEDFDPQPDEDCIDCEGTGLVSCTECEGTGGKGEHGCDECSGTGLISCPKCYGNEEDEDA